MASAPHPFPRRGEIWFIKLPTGPPEKGIKPVLIVSVDARNRNDRAHMVLAVPLTTSIHKDVPTHIVLTAGETGLRADSAAKAEDITVVRKTNLIRPRSGPRQIAGARICQIGRAAQIAIGCAV
jgi:mRNA-degrading endonuclease toxin of MazEF toxin-antitoxin module